MVKPICRDTVLLSMPAKPAGEADLQTARDLADMLLAHRSQCVGMAANMIGVPKCIIAILLPGTLLPIVMLNPKITAKSGAYQTQEGCLSLPGERPASRWRSITVRWTDMKMQPHQQSFEGFAAQIIQHETDHLAGILI